MDFLQQQQSILEDVMYCKGELKRLRDDVDSVIVTTKKKKYNKKDPKDSKQIQNFQTLNDTFKSFLYENKRLPSNREDCDVERALAEWYKSTLQNEKNLTQEQSVSFSYSKGLADGVSWATVSIDDLFNLDALITPEHQTYQTYQTHQTQQQKYTDYYPLDVPGLLASPAMGSEISDVIKAESL